MIRSRCASLRQLLRQPRLPSGSCLWLCFAPVAARPLRLLSSRIFLPVIFESSRRFSSSPKVLERKDHFPKDLYEAIAEGTLDGILESLEYLAETRTDIDIKYKVFLFYLSTPRTNPLIPIQDDILTLTLPQGIYVFNKQPQHRQIWLSSPISGPKQYFWDHRKMNWIDAQDGSTLSSLIRAEIGIEYDMSLPIDL
jgi:frataxin-like iron-binding protein CyaY